MNWLRALPLQRSAYVVPFLVAFPFLAGANGSGCSSVPIGSGASDAGVTGDDGSAASDAGAACTPADCASAGSTAEGKVCDDGSTVARTVCTRESNGLCAWDFPACPTLACTPADCAGLAAPAIAKACPDGSYVAETVCTREKLSGQCAWDFPACPSQDAAVVACPAIACASECQTILDGNGCVANCVCPAPDAGGAADGGAAIDGGPCTTDSDCSGGGECLYPQAAGCSATGSCFIVKPEPVCNAIVLGCACDGTEENTICTGLPSGYLHKPFAHTGACN